MKKVLIFSSLFITSLLIGNSASYAEKLKVKPEIFNPSTTKTQAQPVKLRSVQAGLKDLSKAKQAGLPALTSAEISKIKPAGKKRPIQVGINRNLSAIFPGKVKLKELDWQTVNGGRVANILITSEGAESLRLSIAITKMTDDIEIRFFSPSELDKTYPVYTAEKIRDSALNFWSPSIVGEQIGMEIYLPSSAEFSQFELQILEVSHIFQDISKPLSQSSIPSIRAASESCNIDVACAPQDAQEMAKSVAKYIYTSTSGTFLCSGTLLADADSSTQIPYFFTANHCVNTEASAQSMELHWFYRLEQCSGSTNSASFQITNGGGALLATSATTDFSLVQLDTNPPAGVALSGWSLESLQTNDDVFGLHHPNGDIKKYSKGLFKNFESITNNGSFLSVSPNENGDFISVVWSEGITAGGSSGSGLWRKEGDINYLVGALFGGSSFCSAPTAPDDYGRFDRSYPSISQWLNPTPDSVDINVTSTGSQAIGLKDGILIARYIQGLRGTDLVQGIAESEDIMTLESKLASMQNHLDIDGNGSITAGNDALFIIRYMLGLKGNSLIEGLAATGATRTSASDIEQYLDGFLNTGE